MKVEIINAETVENPGTKPLDVMARVMNVEEIRYRINENKINARFPMDGVIANLTIRFTDGMTFFGVSYNIRTPVGRRDEMLRFINDANWKLTLGNLEMDRDDGEVKYRYSYPLDRQMLDEQNAGYLLFTVLRDANKYSSGVMAALTGQDAAMFVEEEAVDDAS